MLSRPLRPIPLPPSRGKGEKRARACGPHPLLAGPHGSCPIRVFPVHPCGSVDRLNSYPGSISASCSMQRVKSTPFAVSCDVRTESQGSLFARVYRREPSAALRSGSPGKIRAVPAFPWARRFTSNQVVPIVIGHAWAAWDPQGGTDRPAPFVSAAGRVMIRRPRRSPACRHRPRRTACPMRSAECFSTMRARRSGPSFRRRVLVKRSRRPQKARGKGRASPAGLLSGIRRCYSSTAT